MPIVDVCIMVIFKVYTPLIVFRPLRDPLQHNVGILLRTISGHASTIHFFVQYTAGRIFGVDQVHGSEARIGVAGCQIRGY